MKSIESLSIFAKILAQENIFVSVENVETAMFDLRTRRLILPNWEHDDEHFQKMLIAHEVAHAIFTPLRLWEKAIKLKPAEERQLFKNIMNIVEDCRIDRRIQERYNGVKINYYNASKYIKDKDFFSIKKKNIDIKKMALVDRINIWFKTRFDGNPYDVGFTPEELLIVEEIKKLQEFDDVIDMSLRLFDVTKAALETKSYDDLENSEEETEEQKKKKEKGQQGEGEEGEGEEGEGDPNGKGNMPDRISLDENGDKSEEEGGEGNIVGPGIGSSQGELLKNINKGRKTNVAVSYSQKHQTKLIQRIKPSDVIQKNWANSYTSTSSYEALRREWREYISLFTSSFERKKNARNYMMTRYNKTGIINPNKLHEYQTSEDIFLTREVEGFQKNHAFLFLIDCSGSMQEVFPKVATQFGVFTEICKKLSIPVRGYGFSDVSMSNYSAPKKTDNFSRHDVSLLEFYSEKENKKVNARNISALLDNNIRLGGTPLADSLYYLLSVADEFKRETKVDVLNVVVLTDGGDGSGNAFTSLQDAKTRLIFPAGNSTRNTTDNTNAMYHMIRDTIGANVIHIDITDSPTIGTAEFAQKKFTTEKNFGGANTTLFISEEMISPKQKKIIETFTDILK